MSFSVTNYQFHYDKLLVSLRQTPSLLIRNILHYLVNKHTSWSDFLYNIFLINIYRAIVVTVFSEFLQVRVEFSFCNREDTSFNVEQTKFINSATMSAFLSSSLRLIYQFFIFFDIIKE